jgi:hypothetical protein
MSNVVDFLNFLTRRSSRKPISAQPAPWDRTRVSIYSFLSSYSFDQSLPREAHNLPDEDAYYERTFSGGSKGVRWVPGALDALFGRHATEDDDKQARALASALEEVCSQPSAKSVNHLYQLMLKDGAINLVDSLLSNIAASSKIHATHLYELAEWLATGSPDREPVKFGIALLGLFTEPQQSEIFLTLGRHDEFAVYAAVALERTLGQPELDSSLWQLAKQVDGWGRVQIVERLSRTDNPAIRHWLLREGYRNSIMVHYLAHSCVTGGELLKALQDPAIDDALLLGAAEMLEALTDQGPTEDMSDYTDGAEATRLYVQHVKERVSICIEQIRPLHHIKAFVEDADRDWNKLEELGWTESLRREIASDIGQVFSRPEWTEIIKQALTVEDYATFRTATVAGAALGIDVWGAYFQRQLDGKSPHGEWYYLMQTSDPERVDQVLSLALSQIDLKKVATGPRMELGIGQEFQHHSDLTFILQELGRFPGKGWEFVEAGLQSPVVSNRNMALRAINAWGREHLPQQAELVLKATLRAEPDDDVRDSIEKVLAGDPLTS